MTHTARAATTKAFCHANLKECAAAFISLQKVGTLADDSIYHRVRTMLESEYGTERDIHDVNALVARCTCERIVDILP